MCAKEINKAIGIHYTVDFFGCDLEQLNSVAFWEKLMPEVAGVGKLEILNSYYHEFKPQGITGFLLLSTSHISFHTWPEFNYVACDIFSCSDKTDTQNAVDYLKQNLKHEKEKTSCIERGGHHSKTE